MGLMVHDHTARKTIGCSPHVNPQLYSLLVDGCHACGVGNQRSSLVWLQVGSARNNSGGMRLRFGFFFILALFFKKIKK
jgi:hypothetical protein